MGPFDELGLDFLDLGGDVVFDEGVEMVDVKAARGEGVLVGRGGGGVVGLDEIS